MSPSAPAALGLVPSIGGWHQLYNTAASPQLQFCSPGTWALFAKHCKTGSTGWKSWCVFQMFFCAFFSCWFGILHVPKHFWKQDLGLVKEIGQVAYTETNYQSRGCDSAQIFSHPIGWWRRARGHGKSLKLREVDRLSDRCQSNGDEAIPPLVQHLILQIYPTAVTTPSFTFYLNS